MDGFGIEIEEIVKRNHSSDLTGCALDVYFNKYEDFVDEEDVEFGYMKAVDERGISSELMAMVVNAWCKVLQNGLDLNGNDGWYHKEQFTTVAEHYGWKL